ncbi:MAG: hypothetical protein AAF927_06245 [Bacteroidota bacterium]
MEISRRPAPRASVEMKEEPIALPTAREMDWQSPESFRKDCSGLAFCGDEKRTKTLKIILA